MSKSEDMKKLVTATVLVAFAGAVAFASFESSNKKMQDQQKLEKKDTKKKKECKRTCLFS